MAGQIVVVATVVIVRVHRSVDGINDRQVMSLLGEQRQMFTKPNAGS